MCRFFLYMVMRVLFSFFWILGSRVFFVVVVFLVVLLCVGCSVVFVRVFVGRVSGDEVSCVWVRGCD